MDLSGHLTESCLELHVLIDFEYIHLEEHKLMHTPPLERTFFVFEYALYILTHLVMYFRNNSNSIFSQKREATLTQTYTYIYLCM